MAKGIQGTCWGEIKLFSRLQLVVDTFVETHQTIDLNGGDFYFTWQKKDNPDF